MRRLSHKLCLMLQRLRKPPIYQLQIHRI